MKTTTLLLYRALFLVALTSLFAFNSSAQFSFTNSNSLLTNTTHSGCAVTVVDVNNDGLDDIVIMDQSTTLMIELQNQNGTFTHYNLGNITGSAKIWGMSVADVDHNGWKDVVVGPGSALYLVNLSWTGSTIAASTTTLASGGTGFFVQNITFGDFNNDGWADLEVCDDDDYAKIYVNTAGTLSATTSLINTNINPGLNVGGDPYDSGNYGSVWTDFDNDGDLDLYIAHCRQSASSNTDQRRRDRLFVNNGSNVFSEQAQAYGIEVTDFKQTWTTSFGDIDNDGDLDIVMTNHGENGQILENDGTGHFTDITAGSGYNTAGFDPIESAVEDFDNDGFLDIIITGGGGGNSYLLFHNEGNNKFTLVNTPIPATTNGMLSFGLGDLNHDGQIDIFASYGNVYNTPTGTADVLYLNSTNNTNHFITFDLKGTTSNIGAIGARVTIYGVWGKQIREVRAGESYGTSNSMQLHFGLGSAMTVDSAVIDWPSHAQTHLTNLVANQFVTAEEGGCIITGNVIPGPYSICTLGQTVTLTAAAGFSSYTWTTGDLVQSTIVSTPGFYSVMVTDGSGCTNISPAVNVRVAPDQTPTISTHGADLNVCQGSSVALTSSYASLYLWSNGETTQTAHATQSGSYSVTVAGDCQNWTSAPVAITVYPAPAPTANNVVLGGPGSTVLTATGNNISWYSTAVGGTALYNGSSYTTPFLSSDTVFYAEDSYSYGGSTANTGQTYHTGGSLYNNTINGGVDFTVMAPCLLNSVKVYTESTHYGTRQIQIRNSIGTVIDTLTVNLIADTTVVPLNISLPVGAGYRITTDGTLNNTNFGAVSPFLQRSSGGVSYPYTINNLLSITNGWTGSSTSSSAYYYFYDWEVVEPPTVCLSDRTPVTVSILVGVPSISGNDNHIRLYPNPAKGFMNVSFEETFNQPTTINIVDLTGRVISSTVYDRISSKQNIPLEVSKIAAGTYVVEIRNENTSFTQRISIME